MFYQGDAVETLRALSNNTYHAIITSPPYLDRIDYGHPLQVGYGQTYSEYMAYQLRLLRECYRVTVPGGAMFLNVGNLWNNYGTVKRLGDKQRPSHYDPSRERTPINKQFPEKGLIDLASQFQGLAELSGWLLRDKYIWLKPGSSSSNSDRSSNCYETILYLRKPDKPGRYTEAYWDGRYLPRNVIECSPSRDPRHPCPLPRGIVKDLILATVPEGGRVIDPYCGIGTVITVAAENSRIGDGIDIRDWSEAWS